MWGEKGSLGGPGGGRGGNGADRGDGVAHKSNFDGQDGTDAQLPLGHAYASAAPKTGGNAGYWSVMMVLVLWLCVLALRGVAYTHKVLRSRRRRSADAGSGVESSYPESEGRDP